MKTIVNGLSMRNNTLQTTSRRQQQQQQQSAADWMALCSRSFMNRFAMMGERGEPIAAPSVYSKKSSRQGCWFSLPRSGPWSAALPQPSAFINWDFDEKAGYIKADQSVLPCDLGISDTLSKDCGVLYCVLSSQGG